MPRDPTGSRNGARSTPAISLSWKKRNAVLSLLLHATGARSVASRTARIRAAAAICGNLPRSFADQGEKKRLEGSHHDSISCATRPSNRIRDFVHGSQSSCPIDIGDFVVRVLTDCRILLLQCGRRCGYGRHARPAGRRSSDEYTASVDDSGGSRIEDAELRTRVSDKSEMTVRRYQTANGATSVREYRERGYLPQAMTNHLFRLGPIHS